MKLQAIQAIHTIGKVKKVLKTFKVSQPTKKLALECAFKKLKFYFPNSYQFIKLKYIGFINVPPETIKSLKS